MKEEPLDSLVERVRSKNIPFSVVFEITDRCNLRCLHCYQGKEGGEELKFAEVKPVLDDLVKLGSMKLTLTGGEPTLRGDFPEIFDYCHQKGFAITLFTNAAHLGYEVQKGILKKPPWVVECSLYGATAKTHDSITCVEGSYERSLKNIRWMVGKGIRVRVKSVLLCLNAHERGALSQLCHELGVTFQSTYRVFPSQDPTRFPERLRVETDQLKIFNKNHPSSECFICNAGREACCISAAGKIYPCVALRWECGHLREKILPEIWFHSPVLQKIRSYEEKDFKECFVCHWRGQCHFCPGMGFSEHGNLLTPSKEMCRLTHACFEGIQYE